MIDSRGHQLGHDLSRILGVPSAPPEAVKQFADATLAFVHAAGYAHLEPDPEFVENFVDGWYERMPLVTRPPDEITTL